MRFNMEAMSLAVAEVERVSLIKDNHNENK